MDNVNTYKVNEEAVKKIAERVYDNGSTVINRNDLEEMFPELKESKDEMIRGKIIATIHLYYGEPLEDEAKEMIAWLEKQVEQKTTIEIKTPEESLGIDSDTYNKIVDDCVYGEQKLVEFKPSFRVGDVIKPKDPVLGEPRIVKGIHPKFGYDTNNGILDFEFEDNWELVEQKPADKVEPKFKVGDYIKRKDGLGCHAKIIFVGGNVYGCEKIIHSEDESPFFEFMFKNQDEFQISSDFKQKPADADLKDIVDKEANTIWKEINTGGSHSIVDSFNQFYGICMQVAEAVIDYKKPTAWSEEDEKMINKLIDFMLSGIDISKAPYGCVAWLKSLKERYTWKPSDEQMKALSAINLTGGISYVGQGQELINLYNDLKKLREE